MNKMTRTRVINNLPHSLEAQQLLAKLAEWGFTRTVDKVGAFNKGRPLYYKRIK